MTSSSSTFASAATERCYHCGEDTQEGQRWATTIDGQLQPMCCPGCKAVAETIVASGLKDYYKHRTQLPELSPADGLGLGDNEDIELVARDTLKLYDSSALQKGFVARDGDFAEATLIIDGISCAACAWLIEHRVNQLKGIDSAVLNMSNHRLVVRWRYDEIAVSSLVECIYRLGYRASPFSATEQEAQRTKESKQAIRRLAVAGIGMMQVMMLSVPLYVGMAVLRSVYALRRHATDLTRGAVQRQTLFYGGHARFENPPPDHGRSGISGHRTGLYRQYLEHL